MPQSRLQEPDGEPHQALSRLRQHQLWVGIVSTTLKLTDIEFITLGAGSFALLKAKERLAKREFALVVIQDTHESTPLSTLRPCCLAARMLPEWDMAYHANARFGITLCAESMEELPSPHPEEFLDPVRRFRLPRFPDTVVEIDNSLPDRPPSFRFFGRLDTESTDAAGSSA